jgi:hypothetical protein
MHKYQTQPAFTKQAAAPLLAPAACRHQVPRHVAAGTSEDQQQQQQQQQQQPWQLGSYYTKKLSRETDALGNIIQVGLPTATIAVSTGCCLVLMSWCTPRCMHFAFPNANN